MAPSLRCWCGHRDFDPFDDDYSGCRRCGTLVVGRRPADDVRAVELSDLGDERGQYSRSYWFERQEQLGLPDLEERSRRDLAERCVHWLRAVLAYRPPPARVLEIGCAHGGFVALLSAAGYDAVGLELSPWVIDYAARAFDVDVRRGPVEQQRWPPGRFDAIVMMDVLEHLQEPLETLGRCAELLPADGLLFVQTPERPPELDRRGLDSAGHRFLEMLLPEEHLYLFTRRAAALLCTRVGLLEARFLEPIFPYDMFFVAGRRLRAPVEKPEAALDGPAQRLVRALLDAAGHAHELDAAYEQADEDRRRRAEQLEELQRVYEQADEDRRRYAEQVEELQRAYEQADDERRRRAEQLEELQRAYEQADDDRRRQAEQLEELQRAYEQADDDRRRQAEQLEELQRAYEQADEDRRRRAEQLEAERRSREARETELHGQLAEQRRREQELTSRLEVSAENNAELDRRLGEARRRAAIEQERRRALESRLDEARARQRRAAATAEAFASVAGELAAARDAAETRASGWQENYRRLREVEDDHRTSRIYRLLVALGRWRAHDRRLTGVLDATASVSDPAGEPTLDWTLPAQPREPGPIVIDLTALLPGGENGGAKPVALELVLSFAELCPEQSFILLTSGACHDELAALEPCGGKVSRRLVRPERVEDLERLIEEEAPSVLFCPTTAPPFTDPRLPLVCLIHDLQFHDYPQFFTADERAARQAHLDRAVAESAALVTISDFVRGTLLEATEVEEERVTTIHHGLARRLEERPDGAADTAHPNTLARRGLARPAPDARGYLLYPANFWPHKNHRMLLTAYALLCRRRAQAPDLVLTGADHPDAAFLRRAAARMGLGERVRFLGYVDEETLQALVAGCRALVFPSLYEGFGLPMLEAMAGGRPVVASRAAALPEVAGNAALLVDPRRPEPLVEAIERLMDEPELEARLVERGLRRVAELGDRRRMAARYLRVLDRVAARGPDAGLFGVFPDQWSRQRWGVVWGDGETERLLQLVVVPPPLPAGSELTLRCGEEERSVRLFGRQPWRISCRLPAPRGMLEATCNGAWTPDDLGLNDDDRPLGWRVERCRLSGDDGERDLLAEAVGKA